MFLISNPVMVAKNGETDNAEQQQRRRGTVPAATEKHGIRSRSATGDRAAALTSAIDRTMAASTQIKSRPRKPVTATRVPVAHGLEFRAECENNEHGKCLKPDRIAGDGSDRACGDLIDGATLRLDERTE
jgi:hypothetical protein